MSESINAVYIVLRKDFDHHTDRKGRLALPIGAGQGAQLRRPPEHDEKNGLYHGTCYTREDRRDHFEVWVKMVKLGDAKEGSGAMAKKRKSDGVLAEAEREPKKASKADAILIG
ncbi:Uu.00g076110.m01.CDS01 [Anthostomella pinea]|uniref:Uu.00g076110.m01.CDS01 n=1 Tax=Anthostomella pinea TaxID=933095 RepID=A0AAI8VVT4_9PEZI|nr:Uu.00g076110.m01.CDS01 [Anthostomella pinea]